MATEKLYYQDAHQAAFEARVVSCQPGKHGYDVVLDRTCFYPEGGGQPADEGTLDGIFVTDVQEIDGEIWHTVEAPLEPGKTVVGKLDFEKRFSNMQNHCGEHIVSGIVHRIYGFNNVGFHMGSDVITVDFDRGAALRCGAGGKRSRASKCSGYDQLSVKGRAGNHGLPEQKRDRGPGADCDDRRLRQLCVLRNPRCKNRGNPSDQNLKCPEIQRRRPRDHAFR